MLRGIMPRRRVTFAPLLRCNMKWCRRLPDWMNWSGQDSFGNGPGLFAYRRNRRGKRRL